MSKRMKVVASVLVAVLLLAVAGTATVMAQEEPTPPQAGANGLLARVAEILGIPQEDLANAFRQAQQEIREEAFTKFLDKAVEKERLTQEEADAIEEWWEQRPEALRSRQFQRTLGFAPVYGGPKRGGHNGWRAFVSPGSCSRHMWNVCPGCPGEGQPELAD